MPGKGLYSGSHDYSKNPPKTKRKSRSAVNFTPGQASTSQQITSAATGIAPSEEQRRALRERQLREALPGEGDQREGALRDQDFIVDRRRRYQTQFGTNFSEPRVQAPRLHMRKKMPILPDEDLERQDPDLLAVTASIDLNDDTLTKVDNSLSDASRSLSNLKTAIEVLKAKSMDSDDHETKHNTERMAWILTEAILPWLEEVDRHFDGVLEASTHPGQEQPSPDQKTPADSPIPHAVNSLS